MNRFRKALRRPPLSRYHKFVRRLVLVLMIVVPLIVVFAAFVIGYFYLVSEAFRTVFESGR